ncbi:MAG: LamG-like jellyroll fold domain-containing protein, partial [Candidatus Neomarinimicrobiota bacterium]|nr:LamG-like jellyroll fold domain-containing protein [Candidatus Neomarinimicrobiota bacterium]
IPVDVVHGVLNAHSPYWQVEQGGIWVGVADFPPTEFDLLSPENNYTLSIDQSNLNESTTFSWESSTDPEGNDISYTVFFYPVINLPDGNEYPLGWSLNTLESNSVSIPHQDIVGALTAQGATTGYANWNVIASDGEVFPALAFFGGHVEVPNSDNLNFGAGNFAISLWFEHYGFWDSLQVSQQLLVKHNVDSDRYEIQLNRMDDGMVFLTAYVGDDVMSANRAFHTDHLYHLVLSRSNGLVTMYMDGENVGEMTSAANTTSDESLYLGVDPFYGENLYGTMTDVTIYSVGLTNESISTLFEDGPQSDINISEATSMVAHWSMIDGINQFADEERVLADISGNSNNGMMYEYVYYWGVTNGKYTWSSNWRTFNIDAYGVLSVNDNNMPIQFALHQNYPNPFNPTTSISYAIPNAGKVTLVIYDMMGREVRTLVDNNMDVGYQSATWDATNNLGNPVGAGVYIYQIQADGFTQSKKMILLK